MQDLERLRDDFAKIVLKEHMRAAFALEFDTETERQKFLKKINDNIGNRCYEMADYMMQARKQPTVTDQKEKGNE